jgi:hypothetical protein
MFRTRTKLIVILAALVFFTWVAATTKADSTRLDAATMKAALRTDTAEEGCFIESVVKKVKKGILPADLVDSTFEWARKKPTRHRFQYFKQALIVRAAAIGITISPEERVGGSSMAGSAGS